MSNCCVSLPNILRVEKTTLDVFYAYITGRRSQNVCERFDIHLATSARAHELNTYVITKPIPKGTS